ncbi:hypothetical protein HRbin07_00620 [bacterium HR07]|nr:hypothetical protein HRbin07_00620 [bacterium HR07]
MLSDLRVAFLGGLQQRPVLGVLRVRRMEQMGIDQRLVHLLGDALQLCKSFVERVGIEPLAQPSAIFLFKRLRALQRTAQVALDGRVVQTEI